MVLADPFADSYQERMQGMQETSIEAFGIIQKYSKSKKQASRHTASY